RRRAVDQGFVLSDHADWQSLNRAIAATGASRIFVTHGSTGPLVQWLNELGLEAHGMKTEFEGEAGAEIQLAPESDTGSDGPT
ncbi:MAG TPA: DNA ligase-associated DEXH box helicase, partial [Usitatibacter sp.]|nr:DNA ligase-associated DEXH box helicase [Usitatibacter sp.]